MLYIIALDPDTSRNCLRMAIGGGCVSGMMPANWKMTSHVRATSEPQCAHTLSDTQYLKAQERTCQASASSYTRSVQSVKPSAASITLVKRWSSEQFQSIQDFAMLQQQEPIATRSMSSASTPGNGLQSVSTLEMRSQEMVEKTNVTSDSILARLRGGCCVCTGIEALGTHYIGF